MRSVLGFALTLLFAPAIGHATDANLDPSFGSFGWTSLNDGPGWDSGDDVAVQPDGRIVVVGSNFVVRRFTATGALDPTFGAGGTVSTDVGSDGFAHAVVIQGDGRIVVAGGGDGAPQDPTFVAVRYESDGTLDASFGAGGIAQIDIDVGSGYEAAASVAIQPDGGIVLVGVRTDGTQSFVDHIRVVRLLANGSLDTTFGTGGIVTLSDPAPASAEDVALQSDGRIVVGGYAWVPYGSGLVQAFLVFRLAADGSLDPTFATGGIRIDGPGPEGSRLGFAVAVQPGDGKILLGGEAGVYPAVLRYLPDGTPDATFGTGGIAEISFENFDFAMANDMVLRPDGKIVLVGGVRRNGGLLGDTAIVRFNADGSPDTTFAPGGRARIVIGSRQSNAAGAARQGDGKIVVTGYRTDETVLSSSSDTALMVARFGGSCGNAFLDAGEECDDGNTNGLDCCSAGCGHDPAGQLCDTADGSVCTWDTCDGAGTCAIGGPWPASECLAVTQPLGSSLTIKNNAVDAKDKLSWKWSRGPDVFYYGQPDFNTAYSLCVFGGSALASENPIPEGNGWNPTGRGWILSRDPGTTPGGIGRAKLLAGGPGKSGIAVSGKGPLLGPAATPLATPVTAQLVSPQGLCFGASYATPTVNAGGRFKAKGQ